MHRIASRGGAANAVGVLVLAVALAGCDRGAASASIRQHKDGTSGGELREDQAKSVSPAWHQGDQPVLRYQVDAARDRLWTLTLDGVDLYDVKTRTRQAHISLADWLWVTEQFSCPPDLAIGPKGEVLISSNVLPTLWRIDPVTLAASKHELVLDGDAREEIGFTGLAYSAEQGVFFAVSAMEGSLWRIDPLFRRAQSISLSASLPRACGLAMRIRAAEERASRFVELCVRAQQRDWRVSLTPDQRSGYVRAGKCSR
jgi:hypothetical protein